MTRIYLLPYGGGSASSYRAYAGRFPPEVGRVVPVEVPGRGKRAHEKPARSMRECAALALREVDTTGGSYILHGHCMGALLALEAVRLLEARREPLPDVMVISGRNGPTHVNDWLRRVPDLDDRALFAELQELGGIPKGLSLAMARPFLSVLRHDQAMFQDYDPGDSRVGVPLLVLAGREDKMTTATAVAQWERYTTRTVSTEWLDGGHYSMLDPERIASRIDAFAKSVIRGVEV